MATHANDEVQPFGTYAPGPLLARILAVTSQPRSGRFNRRLVFALRRLGALVLGGRPADVERLGCRWRLYPAENTAEKRLLFTPHLFDGEERALLATRLKPGFTFADVGANVGGYALAVAALAGPDARIVAVEPQPDIFARLATNIALNRFRSISAFPYAVSDTEGDVTLHIHPGNKGESSILAGPPAGGTSVAVPCHRLETLLRQAGLTHLDAMKLDVEGVEDRILTDLFTATDPSLHPVVLIVEDAPTRWAADVPRLIEAHGYRPVLKTATNLIYSRDA